MRTHQSLLLATAALLTAATTAAAQTTVATTETAPQGDSTVTPAKAPASGDKSLLVPQIQIQNIRPNDQRGINVFEAPKNDAVPFTGFKLNMGAAFTQQFQGLSHRNTAQARLVNGVNANQLITVGHGFNNAVANAYLHAQVARGIRVQMTSYLSARHHNETWVKDGYLLIDDSPLEIKPLETLMRYVTVKAGHFEINYGDAHFRRTDNGHSLYNPLVGNYIMDAFTTQVGTEVYLRGRGALDGAFVMGSITNGEVRGMTLNPQKRSPAYIGKVGVDRQVTPDLRVRLTGSLFSQARSANQTLYSGDRAGSRYYNVLENTTSTEAANFTSGAINPGLNEMHAAVINPFVKFHGLELFGNIERARGRAVGEAARRQFTQHVVEGTYRLLDDRFFVSSRYNAVEGRLAGTTSDVTIKRSQLGGGWFITPVVMMKGEWVNQTYGGFAPTDIRNGGRFKGFMLEAALAF